MNGRPLCAEDEHWLAWALRLERIDAVWDDQVAYADMPGTVTHHPGAEQPALHRARNARYRAAHLEADRAATRERMRRLRAKRREGRVAA